MEKNINKEYVGDGVYVSVEHAMLKITTENGYNVTNTIYLEPQVFIALKKYFEKTFPEPK